MALIPEAKRNVAVLGASQKPERYSNQAVRLLANAAAPGVSLGALLAETEVTT